MDFHQLDVYYVVLCLDTYVYRLACTTWGTERHERPAIGDRARGDWSPGPRYIGEIVMAIQRSQIRSVLVFMAVFGISFASLISAADAAGTVIYRGQGLIADELGGFALQTELCGVENGADVDGPYLLWVLTATKSSTASISGPWGTEAMTKTGNGTFKFVSGWYSPSSLPGAVSAWYDGNDKNPQVVISHGCRPFETIGAWCSPGYWHNATDNAWALTGYGKATLFNLTVVDYYYGAPLTPDATLYTVVTTTGGTYKGPGVGGSGGFVLNAFNATGAFLTDNIPGYHFDPSLMSASEACPIDHWGNYKN